MIDEQVNVAQHALSYFSKKTSALDCAPNDSNMEGAERITTLGTNFNGN
jgi:hypothetical protein